MALDHYLTLGRSGLRVSPFALGAMTFGDDPGGAGCSAEESEAIIDGYLERGGNFIDTANFYTNGHSEKILGDYLAKNPQRRDRVVVASKFFTNMTPGDPNGGGAGRRSILSQLEQSLRRLRTDHLDLYWLHNWDRHTPIEETMRTLDDLVRAGKIRYIGFSNIPAWVTAQAQTMASLRSWTPLIALQVEYSLLARDVEGETVPPGPRCRRLRAGPVRGDPGRRRVPGHRRGLRDRRRTRQHRGGGVAGLAALPAGHRGAHPGGPPARPSAEQPGRPRRRPRHRSAAPTRRSVAITQRAPPGDRGRLRLALQFAGTTVDGTATGVYPPLMAGTARY